MTDDVLMGNIQGGHTDNAGEIARATQILGDEWVQKVKEKLKKRNDSLLAAEHAKVEAVDDEVDCVSSLTFCPTKDLTLS